MRTLLFIGQGLLLAFVAFVMPACHSDFKAGSLGAVKIKRDQPIEIRALLSHTEVLAPSSDIQTAIEIAIKDFGPINGYQVSIEILDEMCTGEGGRVAAEAVVADARVVGVIGTLCSDAAVEASPIMSKAGLSMVSPSNTSPVLTSDLSGNASPHYYKGYYRVADNDLIEAGIIARFSYEVLGLRTMVTVHDGDAYTLPFANAFAAAFLELGGTVPVIKKVTKGQTDMTAVLDAFDEADPDGMVIPLFPDEATSLIKQTAQRDGLEGVRKIGSAATLTTNILALPESKGFYFSAPDLRGSGNVNQATGRSSDDILTEFKETNNGEPPATPYWKHGYDAATLLLSAIKQVAVSDGDTLHIDRAALRDALDGTAGFQGILGTLTCDDFGDCGIRRSVVHLYEDTSITDPSRLPIVYEGSLEE